MIVKNVVGEVFLCFSLIIIRIDKMRIFSF